MTDIKGKSNDKLSSDFEGVNFRPLKENEVKFLFGLWQLAYIEKKVQVTADMICKRAGLSENQFSIALRDLRQISTNCYVKSNRGAIGKLAVYNLIDDRLISTTITGLMVLKLYSDSSELRVKFDAFRDEIIRFFGTDEKVKERLDWLIGCRYLRNEEQDTYVFCDRFNYEVKWIKKIAEYSKI